MAVLTANTKRETGKKAQSGNIMAAKVNLAARANSRCVEAVLGALPTRLTIEGSNVMNNVSACTGSVRHSTNHSWAQGYAEDVTGLFRGYARRKAVKAFNRCKRSVFICLPLQVLC